MPSWIYADPQTRLIFTLEDFAAMLSGQCQKYKKARGGWGDEGMGEGRYRLAVFRSLLNILQLSLH